MRNAIKYVIWVKQKEIILISCKERLRNIKKPEDDKSPVAKHNAKHNIKSAKLLKKCQYLWRIKYKKELIEMLKK